MPNEASASEPNNDHDHDSTSHGHQQVHAKIGQLTRQLHDTLRELGYADKLRGSMDSLPDAQSRLTYIARLTGEAAEKVLGCVEQAKVRQDALQQDARRLGEELRRDPVAAVATGRVYNFITDVQQTGSEVDAQLTEIMLAQDFHDLTGQVIARVVNLAASIEEQLVGLLLQTAPTGAQPPTPTPVAPPAPAGLDLRGPVVGAHASDDVVTDQSQVDDLLASLGF